MGAQKVPRELSIGAGNQDLKFPFTGRGKGHNPYLVSLIRKLIFLLHVRPLSVELWVNIFLISRFGRVKNYFLGFRGRLIAYPRGPSAKQGEGRLENGRIVLFEKACDLLENEQVRAAYIGV
jgi:hypothetical protein